MKIQNRALIILLGSMLTFVANASPTVPVSEAGECMEGPLAQFGRYIGNWTIEDEGLSAETGNWEPGQGAQWNFVCLGGMSIQDFWLPAGGGVGTNLRTWNADKEAWDIAWTVTDMAGFAHITAKQLEDGSMEMRYVSPTPEPDRRITFFPPDENGWKWKLEITQDGGENWLEVYRIKASPASP